MNYQINKEIENIIKDKRVVVIGPSKHLVGKGIGKLINEYDIICRVNYIVAEGYENDYGDRCDLFFYNCATQDVEMMSEQFKKNPVIVKNIKLAVCPVVKGLGPDPWNTWKDDFIAPVIDNFKKVDNYGVPFHWIGIPNYRVLYDRFGVEPNSGMLTVAILLYYPIKELFVTGFSFYQQKGGNYNDVYFNNYIPIQFRNLKWSGCEAHQQGPQIELFKAELKKHKNKIRIDSFLNKLLSLNHSNILDI